MSQNRVLEMLETKWARDRVVCVGLDSAIQQLPSIVASQDNPQLVFNEAIIEKTIDATCAYKFNLGFYLETGPTGITALASSIEAVRKHDPNVPVILDGKFGDIGNTNDSYARFAFEFLGADAITVSPYVGGEALHSFMAYEDRLVFILSRTSNSGSEEFQGTRRFASDASSGEPPMYETVAGAVARQWNIRGNCGLVVGATVPAELQQVRALAGDMPILVPGVGAQGGDLRETIGVGRGQHSIALLVNVSRSLIFASSGSDHATASRDALDDLNRQVRELL